MVEAASSSLVTQTKNGAVSDDTDCPVFLYISRLLRQKMRMIYHPHFLLFFSLVTQFFRGGVRNLLRRLGNSLAFFFFYESFMISLALFDELYLLSFIIASTNSFYQLRCLLLDI